MRKQIRVLTAALLCVGFTFSLTKAEEKPAKVDGRQDAAKKHRLLVNIDEEGWWGYGGVTAIGDKTDPKLLKKYLEDKFIGAMIENKVDRLTVCLWSWFKCEGRSKVAEKRRGRKEYDVWDHLYKAGQDPVDIMINRCHESGIEFVAGMRMNDSHPDAGCPKGQFIKDHPEWQLTRPPAGTTMDYSHDAVRNQILAYIEDMLATYDVDGVEFDYLRSPQLFQWGEGSANAGKLTDFTKRTRALLDAAAAKRGRKKLLLGVRVPQYLEECRYLGFDVAAWVKEGGVDYVCPSDWWYTDMNTKIDDFVKLTEGTTCRIYPSISPSSGASLAHLLSGKFQNLFWTDSQNRAAARVFLAFGADGLQTYNFYGAAVDPARQNHAIDPSDVYRSFRPLLDPTFVAGGDRHYIFPLHRGVSIEKTGPVIGRGPMGFTYLPVVRLNRARQTPLPQGVFAFRLAEDLTEENVKATLKFKAIGITEKESFDIQLNCFNVPEEYVTRSREEVNGLRFYQYSVDLDKKILGPHIVKGDNQFFVRFHPDWSEGESVVTVGELEVYVSVQ